MLPIKYIHNLPIIMMLSLCRRSLSLIESLLHLSEQGHYEEVMELLSHPMKHCPEILFLGLIRTQVHIEIYLMMLRMLLWMLVLVCSHVCTYTSLGYIFFP